MEFSINRSFFLERVSDVARAISPHSPSPVYSGIYIIAHEDHLTLIGTDTALTIITEIYPGELNSLSIESAGSLIVESRMLLEILRKMSGERIVLEQTGERMVQLSDEQGKYNLVIFSPSEYKVPDIKKPEINFRIKIGALKKILGSVAYAASEKDARTVLMGVNFETQDEKIQVTATDSYRMAIDKIDAEFDEAFKVTIPVRTLNEVTRIVDGEDDEMIDVWLNRRKIQFVYDKTLIQSTLHEGTYPDVSRIIPRKAVYTMEVEAGTLISFIDRSTLFRNSSNIAEVRLNLDTDRIRIESQSETAGKADQELFDLLCEGAPINLSVNGVYLLEALRALHTQGKVRLEFAGELLPVKITSEEDENLLMIVVPMRSTY